MDLDPTVGRIVHVRRSSGHQPDDRRCLAAIVAEVNADGSLELAVFTGPAGPVSHWSDIAKVSDLSGGGWHWPERES